MASNPPTLTPRPPPPRPARSQPMTCDRNISRSFSTAGAIQGRAGIPPNGRVTQQRPWVCRTDAWFRGDPLENKGDSRIQDKGSHDISSRASEELLSAWEVNSVNGTLGGGCGDGAEAKTACPLLDGLDRTVCVWQ